MISELKIKNFKSHRDTLIKFSSGVNVIVGSPQAGKTNILRAISLVVNNRPLGAGYIPDFRPDGCTTEVLISLSDGNSVRLEKDIVVDKKGEPSISATRYAVNGEEPTSNLSDVAINILNLDEINLQKQTDQPFLAVSSGGEVARYINKITKLDQSDEWVKELSRMIRKHDETISLCDENIDKIDLDLEKMSDLYTIEEFLSQASELDAEISLYSTQLDGLNRIFVAYDRVVEFLSHIDLFEVAMADSNKAKDIDCTIDRLTDERTLLAEYICVKQLLEAHSSVYKKLAQTVQKVSSAEEEIRHLVQEEQAIGQLRSLDMKIGVLAEEKLFAKETYIELMKELGKCPTCFSDLGNKQILMITNGLEEM